MPKNNLDTWQTQKRRRGLKIWMAILIAVLVFGLLSVRERLRHSSSSGISGMKTDASAESDGAKEVPVWDGRQFVAGEPSEKKAQKMTLEENYSFRLSGAEASPLDEKKLILNIGVDLIFSQKELLAEIQEKQNDLRILINFVVSSKNLDEIRVDSLRPLVLEQFNGILKKGKVEDVRFFDFRVERKKSASSHTSAVKPVLDKTQESGHEIP